MKILALEFSSPQRSVAVFDAAAVGGKSVTEVVETGGRSTRALGMIGAALGQAQIEREQIECLAIGLGPGSYTGIRAAISLAQGWQIAREVKLVGISSAEAIAAQAQQDGLRGRVAVIIDAQRNEFYLAEYELGENGFRELQPLRLGTLPEARALAERLMVIGPEASRWFSSARVVFPRAATVAGIASDRNNFVSGEQLTPIYLRETQFVKAPPPRHIP